MGRKKPKQAEQTPAAKRATGKQASGKQASGKQASGKQASGKQARQKYPSDAAAKALAHEQEVREAVHAAQQKRKSCSSKKRYPSRVVAEAAIYACEEHGTTGLTCYECEICGGWHLTSHPWDDSR